MPVSDIVIKGAREHNLQSVDLVLPRNQLICLTGVSGSGKSSLAFDTVYAEGQRRYVESLSSFARQFLGQMPKPEVDFIAGLSPSISISQKSTGTNPRSTVGTITEISDYLRVLFARVGQSYCPVCGDTITAQTREQIAGRILQWPRGTRATVLAPLIRGQKGQYRDLFQDLLKQGFVRARVDGQMVSLGDDLQLDRRMRHDIEVVIDRLVVKPESRGRLAEAIELGVNLGRGSLIVAVERSKSADNRNASKGVSEEGAWEGPVGDTIFSIDHACPGCGRSFQPPSPQLFSFNSPHGMCPACDGLGELFTFDPALLVPDSRRGMSFKQGCFDVLGVWKELGRWKRHIYQGVAETVERTRDLPPGTMLETPWAELPPALQQIWLYGTGEAHITFTWRGGKSPLKYGGRFEGIIPMLRSKYRSAKNRLYRRYLEKYMRTTPCAACAGTRLNPQACAVRVTSAHPAFADRPESSLPEVCRLPINRAAEFFQELVLDSTRTLIATEVLKEIRGRLQFLLNVGLEYLTLERTAPTLSGGESQRIRLAGQIGSGLVGVLYILDEPSIGLHPRDNDQLLQTLARLRDMGNTVLVVEHDEDTMRAADHLIDFGPGPGVRGGQLVASGTLGDVIGEPRSLTGRYLAGEERIEVPAERRCLGPQRLWVRGASHHNLKDIDVAIPLGGFVCVTGVSGSGKSSLVNDILVEALRRDLNRGEGHPGAHRALEGLEHLDKMIAIDQSPIGRTPRSNPGTYIKVFDDIRRLYTELGEAKRRGYQPGRFSFNVRGGRCEACEGNGSNRLEMDFLADVWVPCPVCAGHRYNRETLQVRFKDKSIADVLEMDVQQALALFENIPRIRHKLQTLHDVGLDYLKLGQPSPTLSGGEAQRIKLARELVKRSTGQTLYLLDEPTTGLHFADIKLLLQVLHGFAEAGNTVLVVEHNLEVIKTADWVIDLGPEGGDAGGRVVAAGTPEQLAACETSYTGQALARVLEVARQPGVPRDRNRRRGAAGGRRKKPVGAARKIVVRGAQQHNLKAVDARIPRDRMTVFCGPSGSGKSSLAMDTIYAEGQRRYVESLSAYARQFVGQMPKPRVDHIDGLSPAIAIEQKNMGNTPRSTVGTVTEIYDYLRILMARLGQAYCPDCDVPVGTQTVDEVIDKILSQPEGSRLYLMAPVEIEVGRRYASLWDEIRAAGYARIRVDGVTYSLDQPPEIDRRRQHRVEVVVDRVIVRSGARGRIADSVENALALGRGVIHVARVREGVAEPQWPVRIHSQHRVCERCGRSFEPLTPHAFSFNSSLGWCAACEGLGVQIGSDPSALVHDAERTLSEGALTLWPHPDRELGQRMLAALAAGTGLPLDKKFDQLNARERRLLMQGTGEQWFEVAAEPGQGPGFRFQFKGLYPALDQAARLVPHLRPTLDSLVAVVECSACGGSRLRDDAAAVRFRRQTLDELCRLPLAEFRQRVAAWKLSSHERNIAGELVREITARVRFLLDVGLDYLSLSRGAATLSNGEAQRIRLASQLGSGLCGVLYVLDEPTIGLHPRDNQRLLRALHKLRDLGNTLLVVEHDREVIAGSDQLCDFGPGAGKRGGEIVAQGSPLQVARRRRSVTGPYLNGQRALPVPNNRRVEAAAHGGWQRAPVDSGNDPAKALDWLTIRGARHRNLKNIDVRFPLGTLTAVTGVRGCGKSSLIDEVLYAALARRLHRAALTPGAHDSIQGLEHINKVIRVDQQPLGNSPSSNPATYTGVFDLIRQLFAQLPAAKVRGYTQRRFSFNVPGGRCEDCEGNGQKCIEMHFLPDVWVQCETCRGRRYNPETLAVTYHGHSISEVLEMTCGDALRMLKNLPKIRRILQTLCDVGLDYLTLGQPAPTLSGGEAQRVKLAAELARPDTGRTLYLLDEPTTGLHFDDLARLLEVLHRLVDLGNTVVVIEHNLDLIKQADWVIDMGPEAGEAGGRVVVEGPPEHIVATAGRRPVQRQRRAPAPSRAAGEGTPSSSMNGPSVLSHTARALTPVLVAGPHRKRDVYDSLAEEQPQPDDVEIREVGLEARMPWQIDGRRWHTQDRVGRRGEPCHWDGQILERLIDHLQQRGDFRTDWNARSVVEVTGEKKTHGWFLHAITGEAWLLKLKFRMRAAAVDHRELAAALNLKTLNEIEEMPVYGNEPRVRSRRQRGPWQEVEIRAHRLEEIDKPAFWAFVDRAADSFQQLVGANDLESHLPWKKLGKRWHLLRKGFPPGKRVAWPPGLLDRVFQLLDELAPDGQYQWGNQQRVHFLPAGRQQPWATLHTKKPAALELILTGPKNLVGFGRVTGLAWDRELNGNHPDRDLIKLRFRSEDDLNKGDLRVFLGEHLAGTLQQ